MNVIRLSSETDFRTWRKASRRLIIEGVPPEAVEWAVDAQDSLFDEGGVEPNSEIVYMTGFSVPASFIRLSETVALHHDRQRFALLYRLLWRVRKEPQLLAMASDGDVARARLMQQAVARDIHKMHAYVRFRQTDGLQKPLYIAWFEPSHYILEAAAPFFVRRFASMCWSILTPHASAFWDGDKLHIGPGAARLDAPNGDVMEALWRHYYASIFNPARLKLATMQGQMPKKYWANLPEAQLIPSLVKEAAARADAMIEANASTPRRRIVKNAKQNYAETEPGTLKGLRDLALECRRCPLWEYATQTVVGDGSDSARVMFIGEQPSDQEDITGKPFVGPAGKLLNRALKAAGLNREAIYLTNAVKHFKFELRGKRRLHKTPEQRELEACHIWLEQELELVQPRLVVTMGNSALRAVTGLTSGVSSMRGRITSLKPRTDLLVTVHPSSLLRAAPENQAANFRNFVSDLMLVQPYT